MGRVDALLLTPACDPLPCHIKTRTERGLTGCPGLGVEGADPERVRAGLSERLADGVLVPPPGPSNCLRLRANTSLNGRCAVPRLADGYSRSRLGIGDRERRVRLRWRRRRRAGDRLDRRLLANPTLSTRGKRRVAAGPCGPRKDVPPAGEGARCRSKHCLGPRSVPAGCGARRMGIGGQRLPDEGVRTSRESMQDGAVLLGTRQFEVVGRRMHGQWPLRIVRATILSSGLGHPRAGASSDRNRPLDPLRDSP